MNHYIITKITLDVPKRFGRKRHKSIVDDLKTGVYYAPNVSTLTYDLQEELNVLYDLTILDIKLNKIS